ncbi:hypothetical protein [Streptomyces chartreusis]|uniref:hypothetical protein n=1 Tax=Streptomyces chartreusis TaxID=1969 RepID=UPI0037F5F804
MSVGFGFTSLHETPTPPLPAAVWYSTVFAALTEFIRELIVIGANERLAVYNHLDIRTGAIPHQLEAPAK